MTQNIITKQCDLLLLPVDAIVCSANNWLKLGTGIAGQIRKLGGDVIQDECYKIIKENNGAIKIGEAVVTSSGELLSPSGYRKYIIHSVGMGYQRLINNQLCERILATPDTVFRAVTNALVLADKLQIQTLGFPLMCARRGYSIIEPNIAPRIMLLSMLSAMVKYKSKELRQIVICVDKIELLNLGFKFLQRNFPNSTSIS
jgi:O-acetyl-ADP-ribose deacetylase (regulator of RNase III)